MISTSRFEEWVMLSPTHLRRFELTDGAPADFGLVDHPYSAFNAENIDVGIQWGLSDREDEWEGVWSAWSHFPDRRVFGQWLDVTWQGRPVHRQQIVSADGHRLLLPAPTPVSADAASDDSADGVVSYRVRREEIPFVRLAHRLLYGSSDFDNNLLAAGFQIED